MLQDLWARLCGQRDAHAARRAVLRLEELESRYCPAAPVLDFQVAYGAGRTITLSGQVQDENPATASVSFTGVVAVDVSVNADGTFSVQTEATGLGEVVAAALDEESLKSDSVSVTLTSNEPVILDFQAVNTTGYFWTFSGRVADESPEGLIVRLGGLPSLEGRTVTVNADGTFSLTVELQPDEWGTATAQTTDWWGLDSETAATLVRVSSHVEI